VPSWTVVQKFIWRHIWKIVNAPQGLLTDGLKSTCDPYENQKNMRLTEDQALAIVRLARQVAGSQVRVRVFGSRLDDHAHGGDLDIMLELPEAVENPALMAAQISAKLSRLMHGRKVDVLLSAPNLMRLPIHDVAFSEGRLL